MHSAVSRGINVDKNARITASKGARAAGSVPNPAANSQENVELSCPDGGLFQDLPSSDPSQ